MDANPTLVVIMCMLATGAASGVAAHFLIAKGSAVIQNWKGFVRQLARKRQPLRDWFPFLGAVGGIAAAFLLSVGQPVSTGMRQPIDGGTLLTLVVVGAVLGFGAKKTFTRETRFKKLREASVFYKAVEVRLRAGYTVPHTLQMAASLSPTLRPAVEKCLRQWGFSPRKALEQLRTDLDIPEAETLAYVLIRAYEAGGDKIAHVLGQGARNLDAKMIAAEEKSFAKGRMGYLLYRLLPALGVFGIFAGSLAYHAQKTISSYINFFK
ncbi:MAG: hypothetical protein H0Z39_03535 [Peptococcaceae bacterium]|nr:hypothetical protein [Peptococcaceae bacterium]